jgi:flavin reductase (DIM6/NTAB) family NADH-FMN oxidoreductase RutF
MSPAAVILANEAIQGLLDPHHPKHRRVVALVTELTRRNLRRAGRVTVIVPTAVRVEAGWDRTDPAGANANRLARPRDHALNTGAADRATQLRSAANVSVVDACVAEAAETAPRPVVIVTSDAQDMTRLGGFLADSTEVRVLAI